MGTMLAQKQIQSVTIGKEAVHVLLEIFSLKSARALKYGLQYSSLVPPSETNAALVSLSKDSQILSKHLLK